MMYSIALICKAAGEANILSQLDLKTFKTELLIKLQVYYTMQYLNTELKMLKQ